KLLMGQVRQMTLVSSNLNPGASGGATLLALSTPSGDNQLRREVFWENRNNHFAANDWFNNQSGVELPFLNKNQFRLRLGGPLKRGTLVFYPTYEAIRSLELIAAVANILTATARTGIFTYRDSSGALRQSNLLSLKGITSIDPIMQGLLNQVPGAQFINSQLS